jgi:general stress protein YciG
MAKGSRGDMTVQQAGRRGGETTAKKYGRGFYEQIGRKGGDLVAKKYSHEHFEEIGRMGGQKVARLIEQGKRAERRR